MITVIYTRVVGNIAMQAINGIVRKHSTNSIHHKLPHPGESQFVFHVTF